MKRLFFLLPLAVFLGMAVYFGIGLTKDPRIIPSALIDQPVPNFELPPLKPQKPGLATADPSSAEIRLRLVTAVRSFCKCAIQRGFR